MSQNTGDTHIGIRLATLQHVAGELEDVLKQLSKVLDDLYDRVEPVVLSWSGEAREAFVDKLDEWDRSAQDLKASQKWLHEVVTTGHTNYAAAHRAVLRGWGAA